MLSLTLSKKKYQNIVLIILMIIFCLRVLLYGVYKLASRLSDKSKGYESTEWEFIAYTIKLMSVLLEIGAILVLLTLIFKIYQILFNKNVFYCNVTSEHLVFKSPFDYLETKLLLTDIISIQSESFSGYERLIVRYKGSKWWRLVNKHPNEYTLYVLDNINQTLEPHINKLNLDINIMYKHS